MLSPVLPRQLRMGAGRGLGRAWARGAAGPESACPALLMDSRCQTENNRHPHPSGGSGFLEIAKEEEK